MEIETILQNTGLTYDDLVKKLNNYKALKDKDDTTDHTDVAQECNNKSVISNEVDSSLNDNVTSDGISRTQLTSLEENESKNVDDEPTSSISCRSVSSRDREKLSTDLEPLPKIDDLKELSPELESPPKTSESYLASTSRDEGEKLSPVPEPVPESTDSWLSSASPEEDKESSQKSEPKADALLTSLDDNNKETSPEPTPGPSSSVTEENLLNNLRMQISSLRNKKKPNKAILPDLDSKQTTKLNFPATTSAKKKRKSCESRFATRLVELDRQEDASVAVNDLVSLSDETNIVILDVTGGVDRLASPPPEPKSPDIRKPRDIITKISSKLFDNDVPKIRLSLDDDSSKLSVDDVVPKKSETGVNKATSNTKSPFVSDTLDSFLNDSAQLKISYAIPKLGAEEGIHISKEVSTFEKPRIDLIPAKPEAETGGVKREKRLGRMKAKTVAEMRRNYEKMHKLDIKPATSGKRGRKFLPKRAPEKIEIKTLAEVYLAPKDYKQSNCPLPVKDLTQKFLVGQRKRNSFVLFNKCKIWVSTLKKDRCVARIEAPPTPKKPATPVSVSSRKRSLLSSLPKIVKKVTYGPGPLSKKVKLQRDCISEWDTKVKVLPKVYLEVIPQPGKCISPKVAHLLPIFDSPVISQERAEFAVSALMDEEDSAKRQCFKFNLPYQHNQKNIIVRKKRTQVINKETCKKILFDSPDESSIRSDVSKVIEGLINYVETKEIEHLIFKEDEFVSEESLKVTSPQKLAPSCPRDKKIRKLEYELRRLNCKVISVSTDVSEEKQCKKAYCAMGCVCESLQCLSAFSNHCQEVECMFQCTCSSDRIETIGFNQGSFPPGMVNQLDGQAKKDLAPVERDFTQTFIHAGQDMILVGSGSGLKRACKVPKKYTDYDVAEEENAMRLRTVQSPQIRECRVDLVNFDLTDVVPFCLDHEFYSCPCIGRQSPKRLSNKPKVVTSDYVPPVRKVQGLVVKRKRHKEMAKQRDLAIETVSCSNASVDEIMEQPHKDPLVVSRQWHKGMVKQRDLAIKTVTSNVSPVDEIKEQPPKDPLVVSRQSEDPLTTSQQDPLGDTIILSDHDYDSNSPAKDDSSQSSFKKPYNRRSFNMNSTIFEGEIKVPVRHNPDLLKMIGPESDCLEHIRLVPWHNFMDSYKNRTLRIYATNFAPNHLLGTVGSRALHAPYVPIRRLENKSDLVKWILSDRPPAHKDKTLLNLVVVPKSNHFFAISGYCLRKRPASKGPILTQSPNHGSLLRSVVPPNVPTRKIVDLSYVDPELQQCREKVLPSAAIEDKAPSPRQKKIGFGEYILKDLQEEQSSSVETTTPRSPKATTPRSPKATTQQSPKAGESVLKSSVKIPYRNFYGRADTMVSSFKDFPKGTLYRQLALDIHEPIEVNLPLESQNGLSGFMWKMIALGDIKKGFLSLKKRTIRHKDLEDANNYIATVVVTAMVMNRELTNVSTVRLQPRFLQGKFTSDNFGIYIDPNHLDTIFVGPMDEKEKEEVIVLTPLLPPDKATTSKAPSPTNVTVLLFETPPTKDTSNAERTSQIVIEEDVLEISDEDDGEDCVEVDVPKNILEDVLFCPPFIEEVEEAEEPNRYIFTNIPHFGYLEAHQNDENEIVIFWPGRSKLYKFPNITDAKFALIHYLNQFLFPLPQAFKISLVIMTELSPGSEAAIAKHFTNDTLYFCGDFGVYQTSDIPRKVLQDHGVTDVQVYLNFCKDINGNNNLGRMLQLFNSFIRPEFPRDSCDNTLSWILAEIRKVSKIGAEYVTSVKELRAYNDFLRTSVKELKADLPKCTRKRKNNQNEGKTSKQSKTDEDEEVEIVETIELSSDDDDV